MRFPRASGILLHPTSLPGPFGIGDFGPSAHDFVDFLVRSGQSIWQVLPLGPTGYGNSPYSGYSAFAGNPLLVSPEKLVAAGLLAENDLDGVAAPEGVVDFERARPLKDSLLCKAYENYRQNSGSPLQTQFEHFVNKNNAWLDDYALFRALKHQFAEASWSDWEPPLAHRESKAIARARESLHQEIEAQKFFQFLFFRQWHALKAYANERGIRIVGDIPIFVAHDSADVWTNPQQFKLDEQGRPLVVAGVPPDYFSDTGQLWGNPIYNWDQMIRNGFDWWVARVRANLRMFDLLRIDHFRGFAACWEVPAGDTTAERGRWVEAPGRKLFDAIRNALGELPIIAEDLGVITPDVEQLRDDFNFPGMRVLQFAFSKDVSDLNLPHRYRKNVVAYTGTHDNDTTVGWFTSKDEGSTRTAEDVKSERQFCLRYLNSDGNEINWDFIRAVMASVADTAIIPLQDVLGLGSDARMNLPNSVEGNWKWRVKAGALTDEIVTRLESLSESYGRKTGHTKTGR